MQSYSQEVRDAVLSQISHENHRKLADMLMDGVSIEEIKTHGFDDIQIDNYKALIQSVVTSPQEEVPTPEEVTPSQESTPETDGAVDVPQETVNEEAVNVTDETPSETPTDVEPSTETTEPEVSNDEATEPATTDEIPA